MVLVINNQIAEQLLDTKTCIELISKSHSLLDMGNAYVPLRLAMIPPSASGLLAAMPGYIGGENPSMGIKVVNVFNGNYSKGIDTHQAAILLIDPDTGEFRALVDGNYVTTLRTAAASAVATRYLTLEDASSLALIGAGVQAHSHLQTISSVRNIEEIKIWNRTPSKSEEFAAKYSHEFNISSVNNLKDATINADIICTLTSSKDPILDKDDVRAGTHINAVGSATPNARELTSQLISSALLFTDVIESAMNEAGDILIPIMEGAIPNDIEIASLGSLVNGSHPGRVNNDNTTIYKSLGVGTQDVICADYIYKQALSKNMGQEIEF